MGWLIGVLYAADIELAALLETASVYRSFHGQSEDEKTSLQALVRANAELDCESVVVINGFISMH